MKPWYWLLVALVAGAPLACDRAASDKVAKNDKAQGFGELTVDEVAARIGKPGVHIFDNNNQEEWVEGHVPTATWVDNEKFTAADMPADKDATLIFYCHNEH